ncbi:set1/Ash2 histone methyltransferase complex subunit ASH2 isoform X1 [Cimex lectularius]|uniref:B30.2/SPRY domain-containing protein n=1 Tax=Cimex lectularius TaxID=79782 RepID=A0A8I6SKD6_CIMLE|nr:set1/Ash2 histone methyltransferase complex subunit ASH2 isoform X1 [Cimex lectularius]
MLNSEERSNVDEIKESQPSSPMAEGDQQSEVKTDDKSEQDDKISVTSANKSDRDGNCYCGKERNLNIVELLCANCNRWFHESCIGYQLGKLVPFMMNYVFVCKNCSSSGLESFKKNTPLFPQICTTAMANLMQASIKEGIPKSKFNKDKDIIPFIESHWEGLTTFARRIKQSMHSSVRFHFFFFNKNNSKNSSPQVLRALVKETNINFGVEDTPDEGTVYYLLQQDLTQIKPNYEAMIKQGQLKVTDMGIQHGKQGLKHASGGPGIRRNTKRKLPESGQVGSKKARGDVSLPKLPAHGYPLEHPYNKDGYRYILAEPDPHAPFRQEFDESSDWAGKPIPGWLYRTLVPGTVLLALHDRASQLKVSDDRLTVTGEKGYCMVRATHSVSRGTWYYEVTIDDMKDGSASRLGWAQEYANLQAPLGYDKFGYAWRSRKGTRFHESRGKHYSDGYAEGDTLGFMIDLPIDRRMAKVPCTYKDKPLVKFKSHLYYEEKDRVAEFLKKLKTLPGSKIMFFKNGVCQGTAFTDIYGGAYFPSISLHKNATVTVNFGPNFKYPPNEKKFQYNGMHQKAEEAICEQTMADMLYLTENDGKLRLETYAV